MRFHIWNMYGYGNRRTAINGSVIVAEMQSIESQMQSEISAANCCNASPQNKRRRYCLDIRIDTGQNLYVYVYWGVVPFNNSAICRNTYDILILPNIRIRYREGAMFSSCIFIYKGIKYDITRIYSYVRNHITAKEVVFTAPFLLYVLLRIIVSIKTTF